MAAIETSVRASAALDDLYRRHVGDVYRYTYAVLGNHADAEDVTQTTFVNALRALERGEQPENPSNWLLVIAHNIVRQRWRQAAARPPEVELVHDVPDVEPDDQIELEGLVRALQRIPPTQREALVMRELEGRSYREISEMLGLTTSALETLLFRARRSLADELENVVTCQGAELAMSRRLDGRLSRKERRRLDEHLAECAACLRLSESQARHRKAFKGLAVLPLPVGLALFKEVPSATAASLPTIGGASMPGWATSGTATTAVGATGAGGAATGGLAVGGSLFGGAALKVAAVLVAGVVVAGTAYEAKKLVGGKSDQPTASTNQQSVKGAFASSDAPRSQLRALQTAADAGASGPAAANEPSSSSAEQPGGAQSGAGDSQSAPAGPATGGEDTTPPAAGEQPAGDRGNQEPGSTPSAGGEQPSAPAGPAAPGNGDGGATTQTPGTPQAPTGGGSNGGTTQASPSRPTPTAGSEEGPTATPKIKRAKKPKKPKKVTPVGPPRSGDQPGNSGPKAKDESTANAQPRSNDQPKVDDQPKANDEPKAENQANGKSANGQSQPGSSAGTPPSASAPDTAPTPAASEAAAANPPSNDSGNADADKPGNANGHDKHDQ